MAGIGGRPAALTSKAQQPILYLLGEWLVAPWTKLSANRKDPALASGAAGQLHEIDRLVQHGAGLLRITVQDQGRGHVPEDHRLVLFLARTEALRRILERQQGASRIAQVQVAGTDKPTELPGAHLRWSPTPS